MKIMASAACDAAWLPKTSLPSASTPIFDLTTSDEAMVMPSQMTQQPAKENRSSGRRPTRSTSVAPKMAQRNCWHELMRVMLACSM